MSWCSSVALAETQNGPRPCHSSFIIHRANEARLTLHNGIVKQCKTQRKMKPKVPYNT